MSIKTKFQHFNNEGIPIEKKFVNKLLIMIK